MTILFILGLFLGAVAVMFALQNIEVITVTFFSWHITGSLALILSLAMGIGVFVAVLLILPESIKNYFRYKSLLRANKSLEEELRKQKELTVFAKQTPPTEEIIAKIENGAVENPNVL